MAPDYLWTRDLFSPLQRPFVVAEGWLLCGWPLWAVHACGWPTWRRVWARTVWAGLDALFVYLICSLLETTVYFLCPLSKNVSLHNRYNLRVNPLCNSRNYSFFQEI